MTVIDAHTHAFPDELSEKAIKKLEEISHCKAFGDGSIVSLKKQMKKNSISKSVVATVATKKGQSEGILKWCEDLLKDPDLFVLASVHPDDDFYSLLPKIKKMGFCGVKLHPFYQNFFPDEERMKPYFELCADLGLVVLLHSGNDIAFSHSDRASPKRLVRLINSVQNLKIVAAHFGGWFMWQESFDLLYKVNIYIDTSFVRGYITDSLAEKFFKYFSDRIVFGSDYPWSNPYYDIRFVEDFVSSDKEKEKIFYNNWNRLINKNT